MELQFADAEVAAVCCSLQQLCARWGPAGGRKVALRLQQMRAAPDLAALRSLPGKCRQNGPDSQTWLVDVDGAVAIVFKPDRADRPNNVPAAMRATVISVIDHPTREGRP